MVKGTVIGDPKRKNLSPPKDCHVMNGRFHTCGCKQTCKWIKEHCMCSIKANYGAAEPRFDCVIHGFYGFRPGNKRRPEHPLNKL